MKSEKRISVRHTPMQRFWGVLAFLALFTCGVFVGVGIVKKTNVLMVEELELVENPVPQVESQPKETCQIIEEMLLRNLGPEDSEYYQEHENNIAIYEKLVMNGCSENQMKYHKKIQREQEIMRALRETVPTKETCQRVEDSLLSRLPSESNDSYNRIERAKIYANLSERGCAQNSARYVDLASQELEIARALEYDRFGDYETIEVVETYKRLKMQDAAKEILETMKKLTDPAIDFILEVEKIINQP